MGNKRYFYSFTIAITIYTLFIFGIYNIKLNQNLKQDKPKIVKISIIKPKPIIKKTENRIAPIPIIKKPKRKQRVKKRKIKKKYIRKKRKRKNDRKLRKKRKVKKHKKRTKRKKISKHIKKIKPIKKRNIQYSYREYKQPTRTQIPKDSGYISQSNIVRRDIEPKIEKNYQIEEPKVYKRASKAKEMHSYKKIEKNSYKKNLNGEKRAFLNNIRDTINSNKIYPRRAKRMGIEGKVRVTFDINRNGDVSNIRISNAPNILKKAVIRAIRKSFPTTIPQSLKSIFPLRNISVNIFFKLN